jgi:hypothetical protein
LPEICDVVAGTRASRLLERSLIPLVIFIEFCPAEPIEWAVLLDAYSSFLFTPLGRDIIASCISENIHS